MSSKISAFTFHCLHFSGVVNKGSSHQREEEAWTEESKEKVRLVTIQFFLHSLFHKTNSPFYVCHASVQ